MKKIQTLLIIASVVFNAMLSGCGIDNFDAPDATIVGNVIDSVTKQPLVTEQPNGFRIEYREISWDPKASLQYFWGKADGTFQHTKIFAGKYEVRPVEGAFASPAVQTVTVEPGGRVEVNFTVVPCMTIKDVSIVKSTSEKGDRGIKATFTLQNNVQIAGTTDYRVMVSPNQYTGANIFDPDLSSDAIGFDATQMNKPITLELYGKGTSRFLAARKYYIRVAARTNNGSSRYNFSPIIEFAL